MAEYKGDRVGQQFGPYRLTRLLGAGGFGEVYEADHHLLQHKRAIKLLLERHFHDLNQRERFLREARTLATLEHPNILPVLEVGEEGSILYLVMPFYRRGTLNDLLKQRTTPLPLTEVERFLAQMCAAVGYAHARHIAHLDLKPENMLLHEDGRLVLSDFGLAHLIKQGRLEAGSSASWGTPFYMAPEQVLGQPDQRSDLYALGIILYQLLTNQHPFAGIPPQAVMIKHLQEAPPPLRAVSPVVPATLEPVIQKALKKQPEDRYATAEALLADFRAAVSSPSPRAAQLSAPGVSSAAPTPQVNGPRPVVQHTTPVPPEHAPHAAEPVNITKVIAAGCEIELQDGRSCGILAVGRCATCGRAFCRQHQAGTFHVVYGWTPLDMCTPCFSQTPEGVEQAEQVKRAAEEANRQAEVYDAQQYITSGSAQTALLAAGVEPVTLYHVERRWEWKRKGLLRGYGSEQTEVVTPIGGWLLGMFKWKYRVSEGYGRGAYTKEVTEDWQTALLALDTLLGTAYGGYREQNNFQVIKNTYLNDPFARVKPYSRGYEVLDFGGHKDRFQGDWLAAAEAVKRLIGAAS